MQYLNDMPKTVTQQIDQLLAGQILDHFEKTNRRIEGLFNLPADFAVPPTWAAAAEAKPFDPAEGQVESKPKSRQEREFQAIDKLLQPMRKKTNVHMPYAPVISDATRRLTAPSPHETIRLEARMVEAMDILRAKAKAAEKGFEEVRQFEIKQMQRFWLAPWRDVSPKKIFSDDGDPEQLAFRRPPTTDSLMAKVRTRIRNWIQEKRQKFGIPTFKRDPNTEQIAVIPPTSFPMPDIPQPPPNVVSGDGIPTVAPLPQDKSKQFVK